MIVEYLCRNLNELILKKFIVTPFKLSAEKILLDKILELSPSSLILNRDKMNGITNTALEALIDLLKNTITIINPLFLLISRGTALSTRLNRSHLSIIVLSLFGVFLIGYIITAYDHKQSKKLSKIKIEADVKARSLIQSIPIFLINGVGKKLISWMETIRRYEIEPTLRHDFIMILLYGFLEIATIALPIAMVGILKTPGTFLSIYIIVQPMFWNSWWLFFNLKSIVVSTAPWSQYTEFIETKKPIPRSLRVPDSAEEMIPIFKYSEVNEIKLIGDSGCGKTTLMIKIISGICEKFKQEGHIIYIDQYAFIPSGVSILEYFQSNFSQDFIPENLIIQLIKRANELGISNVINDNTLSKPFLSPSGGEEKRIIFLQSVLPIFCGISSVKIVLLDEVSAGLDDESFSKVRVMIEEIKSIGVKVVSIDHHKFVSKNMKEIEVFKKVVSIPTKSKPKVLSLWQKIKARFFPYVYQRDNEDKDLEKCEHTTEIFVWANGVIEEEHQDSV